ncbi:MAG: hypothetical protein QGI60_03650 [archaeon]|jgi:hypothetical protein|nr:hypothetical protein [archaeon]
MNLQKAFFAETLPLLLESDLSDFDRVYFGHETCDRRLPSLKELSEAKELCRRKSLPFSLVTPFCTTAGIKKLEPLLKSLSRDDEVIVNDFGVLKLAHENSETEIVCGRLLNKQYRDPVIASFDMAPSELKEHLKTSQVSSGLFRELLKGFNVKRVELDNLLQGIGTNLVGLDLTASLYHPFTFIAATRLCLCANCDKLSFAKKIGIFPCKKECLKYSFKFEAEQFKNPLFLFGNALFFENKELPKDLHEIGIDRLVFTAKEQQ